MSQTPKPQGRNTRLMHYGRQSSPGPANPPVVRASTILHDTVQSYRDTKLRRETNDSVLSYGRRGTTPAHVLQEAIADLEGGDAAFLFPSGVAALASCLSAFAAVGDHILVVDSVFPATRNYCESILKRQGVAVDYFAWDATSLDELVRPETVAVIVESPGSQTYEVMDLPALSTWAKSRGLIVIADNTYGSGWLYRPLELGCDVSVVAGTKYLGGHADVMMGAAAVRGDSVAVLRKAVHMSGQLLGPDEAYACLRGMRTLGLRLDRHGANSLALAHYLKARAEVTAVLHPGLASHPGHAIWQRDASGCNGLLSVAFRPGFAWESFVDHLQLFAVGSSWGGFESLAMPIDPAQACTIERQLPVGPMVRLHAGLEDAQDLIADIAQAFDAV